MREIKFRVWDCQNERMVYDPDRFEVAQNDEINFAPWIFYETWQDRDDGIRRPCFVMQFIGRIDKNGKEIYNGDILTVWCEADPDDYEMRALVFWDSESCGFKLKGERKDGTYVIDNFEDNDEDQFLEIIGNIYETPELFNLKK